MPRISPVILAALLLLCLLPLTLPAGTLLTPDEIKKIREDLKRQNEQARIRVKVSPQTLTDEQIVAAMKRGIDFLLKSKRNDNWESLKSWATDPREGDMVGGETALTLLALLEAGQSLDDPRLKFRAPDLAPAVDYVTKLQSDRTYVLSLQACVLSQLPQAKDQKYNAALTRIKDLLVASLDQNVAYGYSVRKENNLPVDPMESLATFPYRGKSLKFPWRWDNSNSQYALLGVWAAADAGIPVPPEYWAIEDALWRFTECNSGGWTYNLPINAPVMATDYKSKDKPIQVQPESVQTPSMSSAGLASLYITQEFLDTDTRLDPRPDPGLAAALKFFSENFNVYDPAGYNLYGIERVGLASGYKYFNNVDWFRQVACTLLASQQPDGGWIYQYPPAYTSSNVGTAYALLILARGRNPILFNKLEYAGGGGTWNARPRDTANLTRWASKTFERPLNWQIINLAAPANEWLDAPILVITGSRDPKFSAADLDKLKAFIDGGGTIFSSADGNAAEFTQAMKKYGAQISNSEFRLLPKDHPIFTIKYEVKTPPQMFGLTDGKRDIWIHSPTDLAAAWQKKSYATAKPPFEIPANLYFYAIAGGKRKLTPKLQPLPPAP